MLDRTSCVLMVIDFQGTLARTVVDSDETIRQAGILIEGCRCLDIPLLWTEQYPEGLGATIPEIAVRLEGFSPMPKRTFSSLEDPAIKARFDQLERHQVLLCGVETHVCVYQTAMHLVALGAEPHVVSDAVSSRKTANRALGLDKIARGGGEITSVETALFELLKVAEGAAFKQILKLVK